MDDSCPRDEAGWGRRMSIARGRRDVSLSFRPHRQQAWPHRKGHARLDPDIVHPGDHRQRGIRQAGPSNTPRETSEPADTAIATTEATQQTEEQIGLTKAKRRNVQRRLTRLGFETKVNGTFDESTRASIALAGREWLLFDRLPQRRPAQGADGRREAGCQI